MIQSIPFGNTFVEDAREKFPDLQDLNRYQFKSRDLSAIDLIVIHHWASNPPELLYTAQLQQIQQIYTQWTTDDGVHNTVGFPYHFAVFPNCIYYIGDITTSRACVANHNNHIICVSLPGNYDTETPTEKHIIRAKELTDNIRFVLGAKIPIVGHQDLGSTHCPGLTWNLWKDRLDL